MKITLCGSTRFMDQFNVWNRYLTKLGHIVYSVSMPTTSAEMRQPPEEIKITLDLVHLAKIEESDAIVVITSKRLPGEELDPFNTYIGESTAKEIQWANIRAKGVMFTHWAIEEALGKRTNFEEQGKVDQMQRAQNRTKGK